MEIQEILKELEYNTGAFPQRALEEAIANKSEIISELLKILEFANKNIEFIIKKQNYFAHIYAVYLLAQFREKRAYPLIVELVSRPEEVPHEILGDVVTEDLPSILASVSCGDATLIKKIIENQNIDEYVRGSALRALLVLFTCGEWSWEEVRDYLKTLFYGKLERKPSHVWGVLVACCCDIKAVELYDEIKQAYAEEIVDSLTIDWEDVEYSIQGNKEDALNELADDRHYQLIGDTISSLKWWACFKTAKKQKETKKKKMGTPEEEIPKEKGKPVISAPKVGRNDPCPCGSGKKYKKCCLNKDLMKLKEEASKQIIHYPSGEGEDEEDIFDNVFKEIETLTDENKFAEAIDYLLDLKKNNPKIYKQDWGLYDDELIALFVRIERWDEIEEHLQNFLKYPFYYFECFDHILKLIQVYGKYQVLYRALDETVDRVVKNRDIPPWAKDEFQRRYILAAIVQHLTMPEAHNFSFIIENCKRHNISPEENLEEIILMYSGQRTKIWDKSMFAPAVKDRFMNFFWLSLEFVAWLKKEKISDYGLGSLFCENITEYLTDNDTLKKQPLLTFHAQTFDEYLGTFIGLISYEPLDAILLLYGLPLYFQFLQLKGLVDESVVESVYKKAKKLKPDLVKIISGDLWKFNNLFKSGKIYNEIGPLT